MNRFLGIVAACILTVLVGVTAASADEYLGSYVARISEQDHQASDGFPLDSAGQMVRQDRANWHKFGSGDREDQDDPWFTTNAKRERFQRLLDKGGAMNAGNPPRHRQWRAADRGRGLPQQRARAHRGVTAFSFSPFHGP